jgi:hypothetical protein
MTFWTMRVGKLNWRVRLCALPPSCGLPALNLPEMSLERVRRCSKVWTLSASF